MTNDVDPGDVVEFVGRRPHVWSRIEDLGVVLTQIRRQVYLRARPHT